MDGSLYLRFAAKTFFFFLFALMACNNAPLIQEDNSIIDPASLSKGDTIKLFRFINPDEHDWKIEIRISGDDLHDIASKKMTSRKFSTTDEKVLERVRQWKFIYGIRPLHKATSTLRVYRNGELYDKYGLILEKKWTGLQSQKYGLVQAADMEEIFSTIEEMY
jgi:hypothetical protein